MSDRPPPLDWENALRPEDIATVAALIENDGEEERSRQYHTHANKLSGNLRRSRHARLMQYDPLGTNASRASKNLRIAASKGDYEELLHAIDTGADVNDADDKGRTALHFVTASGRDAFVQLLIAHGADANKQDANGNSPLHLAACTNNIKVITALIDGGCNIHLKDGKGRTAIHFAQSHLQLLRRYSSDPAAYKGKVLDIVNLLLAYSRRHNRDAIEGLNQLASSLTIDSKSDTADIEKVLADFVSMSLTSLPS
eukprot:gene2896-5718_t